MVTRWQRVPGASLERLQDAAVLLDADGAVARGLNPTAAYVWELLAAPLSLDELAAAVASRYQQPIERVRADVAAFIAQLCALKLVAAQ